MEGLDYVVSLQDKMSGPAAAASQGLGSLTTVLNAAGRAVDSATGKFVAMPAHLSALSSQIKAANAGTSELSHHVTEVIEPTEVMKGAFEGAAEGMKAFASSVMAGDVSGAIEGLGDALAGVASMLDLVYPGLGQVASAVIKLTAGVAGLAAELVQGGIEMAITATQGKQAMISMFGALGAGVTTGEEVEGMLSDLSERIGVTKDALAPLTKQFMAMGVTGTDALEHLTLAAISAQAIMSDPAAATSFTELTRKIQTAALAGTGLKLGEKALINLSKTGANVADVADRMGISIKALEAGLKAGSIDATKFGDALSQSLIDKGAKPLERLGSSLANLKSMFTQSIEDLFEDLGGAVEPLLKEVKSLFSIFGQGKASGVAMKNAIGTAFTYVLVVVRQVIPPIKHFFLDIVIWSLKSYIFIKQHWTSIKTALMGVAVVVTGIALVFGVAFASIVVSIGAVVAVFAALAYGIGWVGGKLVEFGKWAAQAGKDFVDGLVNGIRNGVGMVIDAAKNLASSAIGAVKGVLGISSPSKVMAMVGVNTGEGMVGGMDQSTGKVEDAGAAMGAAAAGGASGGAADFKGSAGAGGAQGGASGGGSTGPITINLTAPSGVTNALELTEIALAALLERLMLQRGGGGQAA